MHILYHHRTAGDGVEGVHIMGVVGALRALGHTVEIAGPPGCSPERDRPPAGEARAGGLRAVLKRWARSAPPVLFELGELLYNIWDAADMLRRVSARRPDVVYERATSNSAAPTLIARARAAAVVQEVNVTADVGRFRPLVLGPVTRRLERWVARRADVVVTVSAQFRRMLIEAGWAGERIVVCPNAVDVEQFRRGAHRPSPLPWSEDRQAVTVGYVGSFLPYHRLDMLVEAARRLAPSRPDLRWLLVGDGVERARVEAAVASAGLAERVHITGRVPHARVPGYVRAMDVAALPNSGSFNSPMKLFEYMAMGRAVVAPDVPAIREVVADGETGLLFRVGDEADFRAAVQRLAADATLRRRLGRAARRRVVRHHTWEGNARKVLDALAKRGESRQPVPAEEKVR